MGRYIQIGNVTIGTWEKPVFIAEIGINHNGNLTQALNMVDAAVESGADIVKFQHHIPKLEMVGRHEWQELMKKCQLSIENMMQIQNYVEQMDKEFLCTPFCIQAAIDLYDMGIKGFKTGSGECNNIPLQEHVASFGKPTLISTGMTSRDELFATLDRVRKINSQIVLMNCTSIYPATPREARLKRIGWLRSTFNLPVGQSDHTPSISTALGAIAHGAVCIEKHFTLNRSWDGPDQAASVLPSEFKQMVQMGMEIWEGMRMCIEPDMGILEGEREVRRIANHSIVAAQYIHEGFAVDSLSLTTMRGLSELGLGEFIPAGKLDEIVGKVASRDVKQGEVLTYSDLKV